MPTPNDPVIPLGIVTVTAHELYLSLVGAEFTEQQALYLVGQILAATQRT
jgi:hypothetical protein